MEVLKGLARRTTQSLREMVSGSEISPEEAQLAEVMAKVKAMESKDDLICQKVIQAARLMEELGTTLKELGEEYRTVPDLPKESRDLAEDVYIVGIKLVETSQEHQKGLKDNGFELLRAFSKQCDQLREVEDTRRHHQLECDFFKSKVQQLRASPQKDFTRLPRNEQILEGWRVELWRVTERSKALCSQLYVDGRRAADRSVLTTVQVLHSFVEIASTGFTQTFQSVRLPSYPQEPVLPPTALPAAPAPTAPNSTHSSMLMQGPSGAVAGGGAYTEHPSTVPSTGTGSAYGGGYAAPPPLLAGGNTSASGGMSSRTSGVYASAPPAWSSVPPPLSASGNGVAPSPPAAPSDYVTASTSAPHDVPPSSNSGAAPYQPPQVNPPHSTTPSPHYRPPSV